MNGIIIYEGKYGATEQYAQWLSAALHMPFLNVNQVTPTVLAGYNLVILGSSVYMGKLTIGKWLKRMPGLLTGKKLFLFIVCGTSADDESGRQQLLANNAAPEIVNAAGTFFLPGRCIVSKLSWIDRLILKMGALLQKDPKKKAVMTQGFDHMDQQSLQGLITAVGMARKAEMVMGL